MNKNDKRESYQPLVSVVIPVYKTEAYLSESIDSVINQTYSNIEIFIIDDGSPDNAYQIAVNYTLSDKRVHLIRQKNMGLSGARNTGINLCKGEFILFLDSDDRLVNNAIEILLREAHLNNADAVFADRFIKVFEEKGDKKIDFHFVSNQKYSDPLFFALDILIEQGRAWSACGVLYKASIIIAKEIRFPVGYTVEDIIFNLDFLRHAKIISVVNRETLYYLQRNGSISNSFNEKLHEINLFIDKKVDQFIELSGCKKETSLLKKDALLCRNFIVLFSGIVATNKIEFKGNRYTFLKETSSKSRYSEAFQSTKKFNPFFNSRLVMIYFQMMYYLIRHKMLIPAYGLAWVASKFTV